MILTAHQIREEVAAGRITIDPWLPDDLLGPNSYDLRLGSKVKILRDNYAHPTEGMILDLGSPPVYDEIDLPAQGMIFEPGVQYLASTLEWTDSPYHVPAIEGRSSAARCFVEPHKSAGFGDIGFRGTWTLELEVGRRTLIKPGARLAQIYFMLPYGPITQRYGGRYSNFREPMPAVGGNF